MPARWSIRDQRIATAFGQPGPTRAHTTEIFGHNSRYRKQVGILERWVRGTLTSCARSIWRARGARKAAVTEPNLIRTAARSIQAWPQKDYPPFRKVSRGRTSGQCACLHYAN